MQGPYYLGTFNTSKRNSIAGDKSKQHYTQNHNSNQAHTATNRLQSLPAAVTTRAQNRNKKVRKGAQINGIFAITQEYHRGATELIRNYPKTNTAVKAF